MPESVVASNIYMELHRLGVSDVGIVVLEDRLLGGTKCRFGVNNNREAVVVCAKQVVKRPSKRSVLVLIISQHSVGGINFDPRVKWGRKRPLSQEHFIRGQI